MSTSLYVRPRGHTAPARHRGRHARRPAATAGIVAAALIVVVVAIGLAFLITVLYMPVRNTDNPRPVPTVTAPQFTSLPGVPRAR
jgi:hypothetical protein